MKKYTSVAALALQHIGPAVFGMFVLVGSGQWLGVAREANLFLTGHSFESLIRERAQTLGFGGFAGLMIVMLLCSTEQKQARSGYTLRRLGIREMGVTMVWGLVFSGVFLLYWAFQVGMLFLLFQIYTAPGDPGPNALFLAAYRCEYFHQLLPLREWTGYLRNLVICLGFGYGAAFGAHQKRHGRSPFLTFLLPAVVLFLIPREPGAMVMDVTLMIVTVGVVIGYWFLVRGGDRNEALL